VGRLRIILNSIFAKHIDYKFFYISNRLISTRDIFLFMITYDKQIIRMIKDLRNNENMSAYSMILVKIYFKKIFKNDK
jgi:hypothetical protein